MMVERTRQTKRSDGIVRRFGWWEGPKARASWLRYFNLKRAAERQPPRELVEIERVWCAVEQNGHGAPESKRRT
jgi:hypothetical protein